MFLYKVLFVAFSLSYQSFVFGCGPLPAFFNSQTWQENAMNLKRSAASPSCIQSYDALASTTIFQGVCIADEVQYPWIFALKWYCAIQCDASCDNKPVGITKPTVVICHPFVFSQGSATDPNQISGQCECFYGLQLCRPPAASLVHIQQRFLDHCSACSPTDTVCRPQYFDEPTWTNKMTTFAKANAPATCVTNFETLTSSVKFSGLCSLNETQFVSVFALKVVCSKICVSDYCKPTDDSTLESIECGNLEFDTAGSTDPSTVFSQCKCQYNGKPTCVPRSYSWEEIETLFDQDCLNPQCKTDSECKYNRDCGTNANGNGNCQTYECCTQSDAQACNVAANVISCTGLPPPDTCVSPCVGKCLCP